MKKLILLVFTITGLAMFASCEDNVGPMLSTNIEPPSFTNAPSGDSFVLTEENADEVALELEWSKPGVGFRAAANYVVEMAEAGTEFADPATLVETSENSVSMTVGELNSKMLASGFPADAEADIDVRLITEINDDVEDIYSSSFAIGVTPYLVDLGYPQYMYLVGDATSAGWSNNNNNMPMVRLPDSQGRNHTFTGTFAGGVEFKLLEVLGQWQPQWGDDGGSLASNEDLGGDPGAFSLTDGDGYYTFEIDIEARTYSLQTYNASGAANYTTIGLIGDSTPGGWDSDTDMTQSTFDPHIWYLNNVELVDGYAKFRAADAWDINWGSNTELSGFGTQGGPDIPVTAGTYNVWFNDLTGGYMFIPVQ